MNWRKQPLSKKKMMRRPACTRKHADREPNHRLQTVSDISHELNRAVTFHRSGEIEKAEAGYRTVLGIDPKHPDALHLMGIIASQKGNYDTAVRMIRQAIQQFPDSDIYNTNLGNALARLNRIGEAVDAYMQALRINPDSVDAINNLATTLKESGRTDEALGYFKRALSINPDAVEVYNNMGNALTDLGQIEAAVDCFQKAIALKPDYAIAYNNMGTALKMRERFKEAIDSYSQSVSANPEYAEAFNNLGETLADMGKPDEAIPFFKKAIELKPVFDLATGNLFYALTRICDWQQLKELSPALDTFTANALKDGRCPPEDPFLNLARHDSPDLNFAVANAWSSMVNQRASRHGSDFVFKSRRTGRKKLVIGYLSNNFHDHPMAHLISRLLAVHNRNAVKVLCFSSGRDDGSDYRRRIIDGCDQFIDIRHLSHQAAARCIYEAKVDILVDLMGYTKGNRLEVCAHRPAPIQVRYLGMAGTTGSSFFDYLIADAVVVPEAYFPYYSEKIVHMPHCYQVNDGEQKASNQLFSRKDVGLPENQFVFCSFNQPYKIDPVIFRTWMNILQSVPESVLWLQGGNPVAEQNLKQAAAAHGVEKKRIIFAQRVGKTDHLRRLELVDLALDTRMVNGAATTSDALWAGVPVIAIKGTHFSSRMSASILNAAGLPELVVDNLDDYRSLAVGLAKHPEALEIKKRVLMDNLLATPLFDTQRFARLIEAAYERMWQVHCTNGQPEHIAIEDTQEP
jgi:protein O-GlcNAc transferase